MTPATNQIGWTIEKNEGAGWVPMTNIIWPERADAVAFLGTMQRRKGIEYRVYAALGGQFCAATGAENEPTTEKDTK